jgi:hypothetical protein
MVKPLRKLRSTISLIPNSGLQFLDFVFDIDKLAKINRVFWEEKLEDQPPDENGKVPVNLRCLYPDEKTGDLTDPTTGAMPPVDETYAFNKAKALEVFLGKWVPLPYFRVKSKSIQGGDVLDRGPTNWARVRVVEMAERDRDGNSHQVVICFDTAVRPRDESRPYLVPSPGDSEQEQEFVFVPSEKDNAWFINEDWVDQWLDELFLEMKRAQRPGRPLRDEDMPYVTEHWARYLTFLEVLKDTQSLPRLRLIDTFSKVKKYMPISVDLMLDVGNSRTCGLLIESHPDSPPSLNDSYVLALRDLTQPERVYERPFESRIEFARIAIGKDAISRRSGRPNAFFWPTVVRIGPEAMRLAGRALGTEGATGLSSPKRYLWDERPLNQVWRFNGTSADGVRTDPPVSGPILGFVTESGDVLGTLKGRGQPAVRPKFCRSALFTLLLNEVLVQALTQINSPGTRAHRKFEDVPRQLRRIVLTMPPAMPLPEQRTLRKRAEAAVQLTWDLFGWSEAGVEPPPVPKVVLNLDEASTTQLVYLYNEIAHKFQGDAPGFFGLFGKKRGPKQETNLRVASIDIGGGTTDLMITTYTMESNRLLLPQQNFREGFKLAGDDVVEAVIELHVLPAIARRLQACGIPDPRKLLRRLFSGDFGGQSELERQRRRQFVAQVLAPVGVGILLHYEQWDPLAEAVDRFEKLPAFFTQYGLPDRSIMDFIDRAAADEGAQGFAVSDVEIVIDFDAVNKTVVGTMGPILSDLCEVVHAYDCDLLLLSGRPSRLPGTLLTILAKLPVSADRVIQMHRYNVGTWYPFRDVNARIDDPKTTAAVGAMLAQLAEGQLEAFAMRTSSMRMRSTARFIGEMERSGQIKADRVLFANIDLDQRPKGGEQSKLKFYAPIFVGFRQLEIERWPGTPLYSMEFGNPQSAARMKLPLTVTLERAEAADADSPEAEERKEDFKIAEIADAEGSGMRSSDVVLRLQTLKSEDGYWLDTGRLNVFDGIIATPARSARGAQPAVAPAGGGR